jgi:hypothetical protein
MQAAPGPLLRACAEACPDRVVEDVVEHGGEVLVAVDGAGGVAVAEEVTPPLVASVERQRVGAVQPVHPSGHRVDGRLDHEVVVRRHQAVRVELPLEALDAVPDELEEARPVDPVAEDRPVVDAQRRDVEDAVGKHGAEHSRHAAKRTALAPARAREARESHTFVTKRGSLSADPEGLTLGAGGTGPARIGLLGFRRLGGTRTRRRRRGIRSHRERLRMRPPRRRPGRSACCAPSRPRSPQTREPAGT